MKGTVFILALLACLLPASAQSVSLLSDCDARAVLERADKFNESISSLQCDFVQTRTSEMMEGKLISSGKIRIEFPSSLEYEILEPYASKVCFDGKNQLMRQLLDFFSGGLSNPSGFSVSVGESAGEYVLSMLPTDSRVQAFLKAVVIHLDKAGLIARRVEMKDSDGGKLVMEFSNVKYR